DRQPARLGLDHAYHRRPAAGRGGRGPGGQPAGPLVRGGRGRAQRHRHDVRVGRDEEHHVGLSAIDMMFFVPAYPFWALTIIAVDVVALYGLCAYGSRANMDLAA